jgi:hypothetical protein
VGVSILGAASKADIAAQKAKAGLSAQRTSVQTAAKVRYPPLMTDAASETYDCFWL